MSCFTGATYRSGSVTGKLFLRNSLKNTCEGSWDNSVDNGFTGRMIRGYISCKR